MKKKLLLSIAFLISLLPMMLPQYGGMKGVQEISGFINLINPIGILSVILFFVGVWVHFPKNIINKALCIVGCVGIVLSEIYGFFTWHVLNITGEISIYNSIRLAFPEFYFGLFVSLCMAATYFVMDKKLK